MCHSRVEAVTGTGALRALRERQVEARRLVEAIEAALQSDGKALLNAEEYEALSAGEPDRIEVLYGNSAFLTPGERFDDADAVSKKMVRRAGLVALEKTLKDAYLRISDAEEAAALT